MFFMFYYMDSLKRAIDNISVNAPDWTGLSFGGNSMTANFPWSRKFQECTRNVGKRSNLSIHLTDKYWNNSHFSTVLISSETYWLKHLTLTWHTTLELSGCTSCSDLGLLLLANTIKYFDTIIKKKQKMDWNVIILREISVVTYFDEM